MLARDTIAVALVVPSRPIALQLLVELTRMLRENLAAFRWFVLGSWIVSNRPYIRTLPAAAVIFNLTTFSTQIIAI